MIGVLVFPDFQLLDAAGPISVFEIAAALRRLAAVDQGVGGDAGCRCAARPASRCWRATSGRRRDQHADHRGRAGRRRRGDICEMTLAFVRGDGEARRPRRQRLLRRLHPRRSGPARWPPRHHALAPHPAFSRAYPKVKLEPDRIFVRDGNIWSSAGITAGIDLALAMVAEDYGDEIAQQTARQLVLYHRRSGGQSQFSSLLELKAPSGRFGALLTWAREHLDAPLTVEDLAEQAGMSSRHFARAFIAETGTTPSKAIERLRIEVARQRVQSSSEAIERVARIDRLSRSRADAARLHPRLRPAAAIAAARGADCFRVVGATTTTVADRGASRAQQTLRKTRRRRRPQPANPA